MPRWPATQTRLPSRGKSTSLAIATLLPATLIDVGGDHSAHSCPTWSRGPSRAFPWPWSGRRSAARPRSGGSSADRPRPALAGLGADSPSRRRPRLRQLIVMPTSGRPWLDEVAHQGRLAGGQHVVVGLSCCSISHMPRHIRGHGPSRAWRRCCPDRACPEAQLDGAAARVILRVTKVSPRSGLSWLNRMPFEAWMP
jgi:hypothetical protein